MGARTKHEMVPSPFIRGWGEIADEKEAEDDERVQPRRQRPRTTTIRFVEQDRQRVRGRGRVVRIRVHGKGKADGDYGSNASPLQRAAISSPSYRTKTKETEMGPRKNTKL